MAIDDKQLQEYRARRQNFRPWGLRNVEPADIATAPQPIIAFYFSPALKSDYSSNTQSLPPVAAPRLCELADDDFRGVVALSFLRVGVGWWSEVTYQGKKYQHHRGLGGNDNPPGRLGGYLNVIAPFESDPSRWAGNDDDSHGKSSCGLFIRGMWQLLGAGEPSAGGAEQEFRSDYGATTETIGTIFEEIKALADGYGALTGPPFGDPLKNIHLGDVFVVTNTSEGGGHIFTVAWLALIDDKPMPTGTQKHLRIYSVDGGNGSTGDGGAYTGSDPCIGITSFERDLTWDGKAWVVGKYTVLHHIKLEKMKASFTEPWILPYTQNLDK